MSLKYGTSIYARFFETNVYIHYIKHKMKVPDLRVAVLPLCQFIFLLPVHEDERDVGVVLLVEVLNLLNSQVQEGQVVAHRYHRLGPTLIDRKTCQHFVDD